MSLQASIDLFYTRLAVPASTASKRKTWSHSLLSMSSILCAVPRMLAQPLPVSGSCCHCLRLLATAAAAGGCRLRLRAELPLQPRACCRVIYGTMHSVRAGNCWKLACLATKAEIVTKASKASNALGDPLPGQRHPLQPSALRSSDLGRSYYPTEQ
jgi:hypothetical protein